MGFKQQMLLVSFRPVVATVGTTKPTKLTTKNGWRSICIPVDANTLAHNDSSYASAEKVKLQVLPLALLEARVRVSRQHMVDWYLQRNQNHDLRLNARAMPGCPGGILSVLLGADRPWQALALCSLGSQRHFFKKTGGCIGAADPAIIFTRQALTF